MQTPYIPIHYSLKNKSVVEMGVAHARSNRYLIAEEAKIHKEDGYMAYIDCKKAFDSVPHSLLIDILELYKIKPVIIQFFQHLMPEWNTSRRIKSAAAQTNIGRDYIEEGNYYLKAVWDCIALALLSTELNRNDKGNRLQNEQLLSHQEHGRYQSTIRNYKQSGHNTENNPAILTLGLSSNRKEKSWAWLRS